MDNFKPQWFYPLERTAISTEQEVWLGFSAYLKVSGEEKGIFTLMRFETRTVQPVA
jgi:hypothetical protein